MKDSRDLTADGLARIDAIAADAVAHNELPGVVAAVARGSSVHVTTAGSMSTGGPPMRRDTLFRISSMTKPITAAATLALVENGIVNLDEPVDALLPELAGRTVLRRPDGNLDDVEPAAEPITVRNLLTFTWGLGMQGAMFEAAEPWPIFTATVDRELGTFGPPMPDGMPDPDTWLARLGELPLMAQPGDRWLYQTGSQVLGVLISRAAGAPLQEVLQRYILGPLGMADTAFEAVDVSRLATAYNGSLQETDPPDGQWSRPPSFPDGGAGLVSSVDDILAFGRSLLDPHSKILRPETIAEMTRNQLTTAQRRVWPGFDLLSGRGWGYGVSVLDDGRYSWDGGLGSSWSNIPDQGLTVVVLTQRAADGSAQFPPICDAILDAARTALA